MIIYDGQVYESASDIPDFGSIVCVGSNGNQRNYAGLVSDASKLPTYDNLVTGSKATLVSDNSTVIKLYEATTKKWYTIQ